MGQEPNTLGVNGIQCGSIKTMMGSGVETCFVLQAHGHDDVDVVQLAVQQPNLPEFITTIVATARRAFPEAMRDVPPL